MSVQQTSRDTPGIKAKTALKATTRSTLVSQVPRRFNQFVLGFVPLAVLVAFGDCMQMGVLTEIVAKIDSISPNYLFQITRHFSGICSKTKVTTSSKNFCCPGFVPINIAPFHSPCSSLTWWGALSFHVIPCYL